MSAAARARPWMAAPDIDALAASPATTLALLALALAQQALGHTDVDVSWFLTFADKWLDGQTPYVDILDPNPPLAFLSLVPAILLARGLHVAAEPIVSALVFLFAAATLTFAARPLGLSTKPRREAMPMVNAGIFVFLVLPGIAFAEREHLALLALAPLLALFAVQAEGRAASKAARIAAGLLAGLAMCFKPYFLLPAALPALDAARRQRSLAPLLAPEFRAAAALVAAYALVVVLAFPAYAGYAAPVIAQIYAPARDSWSNLAFASLAPFVVALLIGAVLAAPPQTAPPLARVAFLAAVGFFIGFLHQGKGWTNHAFPALALALLAFVMRWLGASDHDRTHPAFKFLLAPALVAAPLTMGALAQLGDAEEHPGLAAAVARLAPQKPRLIALARQMDFGHPLTRRLHGAWVGRPNALWTASFAVTLLGRETDPAQRAMLEDWRRRDLAGFAEDVRRGRPDAVIVEDRQTREWAQKRPEFAGALDGYGLAGAVGEIEIWTRSAP